MAPVTLIQRKTGASLLMKALIPDKHRYDINKSCLLQDEMPLYEALPMTGMSTGLKAAAGGLKKRDAGKTRPFYAIHHEKLVVNVIKIRSCYP